MPMMSRTEYAKHRGVTPVAVHHALKAGRIKAVDGKIDQEQADRDWVSKSNVRAQTLANGKQKPSAAPPSKALDQEGEENQAASYDYFAERARREKHEADIAEKKSAELRGELIRRSSVEKAEEKKAAAVRESLLQLPAQLAPVVAAEPDIAKCQDALMDAVLIVLGRISGAK